MFCSHITGKKIVYHCHGSVRDAAFRMGFNKAFGVHVYFADGRESFVVIEERILSHNDRSAVHVCQQICAPEQRKGSSPIGLILLFAITFINLSAP